MPTLLDTAEFALAKTTLDETLQRIEKARQDRLESLRRERAINQASLENAKRDIARQDAEIARLEATTGADILREAVGKAEPKTVVWTPIVGALAPDEPEPAEESLPGRFADPWKGARTHAAREREIDELFAEFAEDIADSKKPLRDQLRLAFGNGWATALYHRDAERCPECNVIGCKPGTHHVYPTTEEKPSEVVEVQSPKPAMLDLRTLPVGTVCEATDVLTCDGKPAGVDAGERFTIRRIDGYLFAETDTGGHYIEPVQPAHVVEPVKHACPRCMGEWRDWPIRLLTDCPALGATGYFPAGMRFLARIDCYMTARSGAMTAVASQYGFEDVPPRSEWCDGSGKGGAE